VEVSEWICSEDHKPGRATSQSSHQITQHQHKLDPSSRQTLNIWDATPVHLKK